MKIKYSQTSPTGTIMADIFPFEDSRASVTVFKDLDFTTMELSKATVNWSCIGSTTPERAEQFAEAITQAVSIALAMDEEPDKFRKYIESQENVNDRIQ